MSGDYYAYGSSMLISPPVNLPSPLPGQALQLCCKEYYSYAAYDAGTLRLSIYEPTNQQWGSWIDLRSVSGNSGGWISTCVPLTTYTGRRVRFAFNHYATRQPNGNYVSEADGWYVDDIFLKIGNLAISAIPDKAVNELAP